MTSALPAWCLVSAPDFQLMVRSPSVCLFSSTVTRVCVAGTGGNQPSWFCRLRFKVLVQPEERSAPPKPTSAVQQTEAVPLPYPYLFAWIHSCIFSSVDAVGHEDIHALCTAGLTTPSHSCLPCSPVPLLTAILREEPGSPLQDKTPLYVNSPIFQPPYSCRASV